MRYLLHTLYLDLISRNQEITQASIRLASRKYFERLNRYAFYPLRFNPAHLFWRDAVNVVISQPKITIICDRHASLDNILIYWMMSDNDIASVKLSKRVIDG